MDRLDAYGKWIFGAATIVGTLGAGFSNTAFSKLRGFGVITFAAAVGIFGVALFFASLTHCPALGRSQNDPIGRIAYERQ